jgi:hypothetical protein
VDDAPAGGSFTVTKLPDGISFCVGPPDVGNISGASGLSSNSPIIVDGNEDDDEKCGRKLPQVPNLPRPVPLSCATNKAPVSKARPPPPVLKTNKPPVPKKESAEAKPTARKPPTSKRPTANKCATKKQRAPRYPPVRTTRAQVQKHAEDKLAQLKKLADEQKTLLAEEKRKVVDLSIVEEDSIEEIDYELSQQVELCLDFY